MIARTFYRRGVIEEWGSGTLKMADLASSSGLPAPEIEDDGGAVTVRFRHGQFVPLSEDSEASPAQRWEKILALLDSAEDGLTRGEIRTRLGAGVSERQVRRALEELKARGLVVSPWPWTVGALEAHGEGIDQPSGVMGRLWGAIGGVIRGRYGG